MQLDPERTIRSGAVHRILVCRSSLSQRWISSEFALPARGPWMVTERLTLMPDTEILEYICNENNRYFRIVPDAAPPGAPIGKR